MGIMQHWLTDSLFWQSCLEPIDLLLGFADEITEEIRCGVIEVVQSFCPMMGALKGFANDPALRAKLPHGSTQEILDVGKRFHDPQSCANAVWVAGDATLDRVGATNWDNHQFIVGLLYNIGTFPHFPIRAIRFVAFGAYSENTARRKRLLAVGNLSPPVIADIELSSAVWGVLD